MATAHDAAHPPEIRTEAASVGTTSWTGGRIARLVIGVLLVLVALVLLGAGGTAVWADQTQREGGYVTTDVHDFSTGGSALTTVPTKLGSSGVGWLYSPGLMGDVRIRVTPTSTDRATFVGIGPSSEVDRYLAGVSRTEISEFWQDKVDQVAGGTTATPPAGESIWVASASGTGPQTVKWDPIEGSWTVVVMNADARPGLAIGADLGAKFPSLLWIALGVLGAGVIFLTGGVLLIAGAVAREAEPLSDRKGAAMSTTQIAVPATHAVTDAKEEVDRYSAIKQYSVAQILGVWAAAALPMGVLAWIVAPILKDHLSGTGNVPMFKALVLLLTAGMVWQFALVAILVRLEQGTLRWSVARDALWLRSPKSPTSGRIGGKLWLLLIPFIALFAVESFLPTFGVPENRDFAAFVDSTAGKNFLHGAWGWFAVILVMELFNTVLGEELLFRGLLLPRMKRAFGRGDWAANGVLFAAYHVHMPWLMPWTLVFDTFAISYPSRRWQSAWIGIAVHSSQLVFFALILFTLVN
jgi:membrane protease YdiL (CAAX protease family)